MTALVSSSAAAVVILLPFLIGVLYLVNGNMLPLGLAGAYAEVESE